MMMSGIIDLVLTIDRGKYSVGKSTSICSGYKFKGKKAKKGAGFISFFDLFVSSIHFGCN
jgi:hypothetical protein